MGGYISFGFKDSGIDKMFIDESLNYDPTIRKNYEKTIISPMLWYDYLSFMERISGWNLDYYRHRSFDQGEKPFHEGRRSIRESSN